MNDSVKSSVEWLTAAECARGTGMTIRALRIYEDQGLISPGRSAAGWRRYGPEELLRLNTIGLLKVVGFTLAQMRDVIRSHEQPTLRQVLELQLSTWRNRRADAERGQAIAEQALGRLDANRSLSVEELCSLIRSFEMNPPNADSSAPRGAAERVSVDPAILERYVGQYSRDVGLGLFTVTRADDKLFLQPSVGPPLALFPTGDTEFSSDGTDLLVAFRQIEGGVARRLCLAQGDTTTEVDRIDAATAARIEQALAERIKTGTPRPGSEQAVRRFIEAIRSGTPNYEEMSPEFAQVVRKQLPRLQAVSVWLGAVVAMDFRGVSSHGWDMYDIQREHGRIHHRIAIGTDGKIYGAVTLMS